MFVSCILIYTIKDSNVCCIESTNTLRLFIIYTPIDFQNKVRADLPIKGLQLQRYISVFPHTLNLLSFQPLSASFKPMD